MRAPVPFGRLARRRRRATTVRVNDERRMRARTHAWHRACGGDRSRDDHGRRRGRQRLAGPDRRLPEGRWLPARRRQRVALSFGGEGRDLERPRACRARGSRRPCRISPAPPVSRRRRSRRAARSAGPTGCEGRAGPAGPGGSQGPAGPQGAARLRRGPRARKARPARGSMRSPTSTGRPAPGPTGLPARSTCRRTRATTSSSSAPVGRRRLRRHRRRLLRLHRGRGLVINEIDYDQVGADTGGFVEIKNIGDRRRSSTASRSCS